MGKTAIIFPGQGSQKVGMANDLFNNDEKATSILNEAQAQMDFAILETRLEDVEDKLGKNENTLAALLGDSIALLDALEDVDVDDAMRLSGGDYASFVVSRVLNFEAAVKIVRKRGQLMAAAFADGVG